MFSAFVRLRILRCFGETTADLCGRKKLPFAGYSIVKERLTLKLQLPAIRRQLLEAARAAASSPNSLVFPGWLAAATVPADLPTRGRLRRYGAQPPPVAWLASRSSLAVLAAEAGGEYRARTGDLLVANQALSQLS